MAYGTVIVDAMTTSDGVTSAGTYGFKNRIINGAMVIDQRNAGASSAFGTSGAYVTVDRFQTYNNTSGTATNQQVVDAPTGFYNSLKVTITASATPAAGEFFQILQTIEGYNIADFAFGTASAKTITLSFWVKSSLTGQFGGAVQNGDVNYGYPFSYTISSANTWEQKTITITGGTSGTWGVTTSAGLKLYFDLGCGSSSLGTAGAWVSAGYRGATGDTKLVSTNGATWNITGVQLEKGSTATSFDYRPYGTELSLCQRYYVKYSSSGASNQAFLIGVIGSTTVGQICSTNFANPMRAAPTGSYSGGTTLRIFDGSGAPVITSLSAQSSSITTGSLDFTASGAGLTVGRPALIIPNGVSCYVDFSAEL
jgi:hypothetical protein